MGRFSLSALGALTAASLLVLAAALACLLVLEQRRARREAAAARRQQTLLEALRATHEGELRRCLQHERAADDVRALARRGLSGDERALLAAAARTTGLLERARTRLRCRDAVARGHAVQLVAVLSPDDPSALLEPLLDDADGDVRLVAARAIGELETRASTRALIRALGRAPLAADRLLEQLARPTAVRDLRAALLDPQNIAVRGLLAEALGLTGSSFGVTPLASLMRTGDLEERIRACRALGRIAKAEIVPVLLEALVDDSWTVRAQAARGLARVADPSCVSELERALSDRAWWVRANAAEALRAAGPDGVDALERAARGSDRFAAERARETLALMLAAGGGHTPWLEIAA